MQYSRDSSSGALLNPRGNPAYQPLRAPNCWRTQKTMWSQIEPREAFLSIVARKRECFAQRPNRRSQQCQILQ
jgi:hypothetical protein